MLILKCSMCGEELKPEPDTEITRLLVKFLAASKKTVYHKECAAKIPTF